MKTEEMTLSFDQNRTSVMSTCCNNNIKDIDFTEKNFESSTKMQNILDEFSNLYSDKLKRIHDDSSSENLQKKVSVLEAWVEDLGEQNNVLVSTVEELEKEARARVSLLQEKLEKMAQPIKDSCLSLRDHQTQMNELVSQKIFAEDEAKRLKEFLLDSDQNNASLQQKNADLNEDLDSLIQIITGIRLTGRYQETDSVYFKIVQRERIFGNGDSSLCLHDLNERFSADGGKSRKESFSSCSTRGSTDTEDELSIAKMKSELKVVRQSNKQSSALLIQRDQHIADLQSQLTDMHHQLAVSQTEVDNATSALQTLRDRGRIDTFEICRRDDVIRQLLSPTRTLNGNQNEHRGKVDMELQLSENIDVMASRLVELEKESQQLRHQNVLLKASHAHCATTINQLQDQLGNSHRSLEDLRSILTNEVTENYDPSIELRNQISEIRQLHNEELQKKNEIISSYQDDLNLYSKGLRNGHVVKEVLSQSVQTEKIQCSSFSTDDAWLGDSKVLNLSIQLSRLENEVSEKNILLRELQNHLSTSRQELYLKDETLYNIEQKLDSSRRDHDEKEDRMMYLTSQLTSLQLEVSKLHGTAQQLRLQLENKSKLVHKLEAENDSLCWQLNDKSALVEKLQKDFVYYDKEILKKKREIIEQKMTITTLQDALVSTKQMCDKLRQQFDVESCYRYSSLTSLPPCVLSPSFALENASVADNYRDSSSKYPSLIPELRPINGNANQVPLKQECPDVVNLVGSSEGSSCSLMSDTVPLTFPSSPETNNKTVELSNSKFQVGESEQNFNEPSISSHQPKEKDTSPVYNV